MEPVNNAQCSREPDPTPQMIQQMSDKSSMELALHSLENSSSPSPPTPFSLVSSLSRCSDKTNPELATVLFVRHPYKSPITSQPRLCGPTTSVSVNLRCQPPSLFLQALAKLNDNSLKYTVINTFELSSQTINSIPQHSAQQSAGRIIKLNPSELTPPDSLTSAPPSYSFVLRQMAARRRPRLMGTFIPSPSFVQHTPPPNYAAAFDIYVDNPLPPPTPRVYNYGFVSMPVVCPACGYVGMTVVTSKITICTHLCAFILCIFFCWLCVPLPYVLRSCKDVYHYCRNCRNFLGMYCPTNPETNTYA